MPKPMTSVNKPGSISIRPRRGMGGVRASAIFSPSSRSTTAPKGPATPCKAACSCGCNSASVSRSPGRSICAAIIGDPDAWQSAWSLLGRLRPSATVVFDGCTLAQVRAVLHARVLPPATLPGHLLYKAVLAGDSLTLFAVDLDSFAERARKAKIDLLPGSSRENGCVLLPPTAELAAFAQAQLAQPGFFADKPFFSLRKLPAPP